MLKKFMLHAAVFLSTILLLWGLLIITSCIPNSAIKDNMLESALVYTEKDAFEFGSNEKFNSISDNYADSILLNVMWNIKSSSPVISSLDTKYYDGSDYGENWGLYHAINGAKANADYSRYWHGSVIFIRPLMLFTDADGVKLVCFTIVLLLFSATAVVLIGKKHYFAVAALVLSLAGVHIWNIRLALEYIPAFMVCFTLCPIYIVLEKKGDIFLTLLSVAGGVMIAFFDFLTVETITVLVPLILVFIIRTDDDRLGNFKNNFILTAKCGICWGLSYIMTYAVKWTAASLVSGENKFSTAFSAAGVRLYGSTLENDMPIHEQIPAAVAANISTLFGGTERIEPDKIIIRLIITAIVSVVFLFIFRTSEINTSLTFTMLILIAVPYVRYMVLSNHSYLHEFFTYRAQISVILGLCAILRYNTDLKLLRKGRKKL